MAKKQADSAPAFEQGPGTAKEKPVHEVRLGKIKAVIWGCGLEMPLNLAGANPAWVIASHEPGIESCRCLGNEMLDA